MADDRLHYFRLYAAELLADENTGEMTPEELGALLFLWCRCWVNGSIPADTASAMRLARLPPDREEVWNRIRPRFAPHPTDPGRLISPRLEQERSAASEAKEQKIEAGRAGGKASGEARRKRRSSSAFEADEAAAKPIQPARLPSGLPTDLPPARSPAGGRANTKLWPLGAEVAARVGRGLHKALKPLASQADADEFEWRIRNLGGVDAAFEYFAKTCRERDTEPEGVGLLLLWLRDLGPAEAGAARGGA
jgi:uncharacterized protein YdaU (DUF1376 family)